MSFRPGPPGYTPPTGPSAPPTRHRRWIIPVAVATTLVALVGGAVAGLLARSSRDSQGKKADCSTPTAPLSATPTPASQNGLKVVEQGFSVTSDAAVTIGGVIANSGDKAAYRTRVTFRTQRSDGKGAAHSGSGWTPFLQQEVPVILPGQRVVVGAIANIDSDNERSTIGHVEIALGSTRPAPADASNPLFRPITTRLAQPMSRHRSEDSEARFTVTSDGCPGLTPRGVAMLFRNTAGSIVGGSLDNARIPGSCGEDGQQGAVMTADPQVVPATADLSKTELSVYCDAAGAPRAPDPSFTPVN